MAKSINKSNAKEKEWIYDDNDILALILILNINLKLLKGLLLVVMVKRLKLLKKMLFTGP